jgi:hypothetical protein
MKDTDHLVVAGRRLACLVCAADVFERRTMTLVTSGIANSGFNKRGELAVCAGCGYVHTFMAGSPLTWERVEA